MISYVGDVARALQFAYQIYVIGFTRAHNAKRQYIEFGEDIGHLWENLSDLKKILDAASAHTLPHLQNGAPSGILSSVFQGFEETLSDCDKLLQDRSQFERDRDNFICNIHFNMGASAEMKILRDRISFLNAKLLTVLKTLEIHSAQQLQISLWRIHKDLAIRIDSARDDILQAIAALKDENSSAVRSQPSLEVPIYLDELYAATCRVPSQDDGCFPMVKGLDAIVHHMQTVRDLVKDPEESETGRIWLELSKCAWILSRLKNGIEYKQSCSLRPSNRLDLQLQGYGISVESYTRVLERELDDLARSTSSDTYGPEVLHTVDLFGRYPQILQHTTQLEPTPALELELSEKLMSGPLQSPYEDFDQTMHLFEQTETELKLVITTTPKTETRSTMTTNNIVTLNLLHVRFIPLYATPSSSSGALNINFRSDKYTETNTALSFVKKSSLLKFQHAITGYEVKFEAANIRVTSYFSSSFIGGDKIEYIGKIQLWQPKRLVSGAASANTEVSDAASTLPPSPNSSSYRRGSITTINSPTSPNPSSYKRASFGSSKFPPSPGTSTYRRGSIITTNSAFSRAETLLQSSPSTIYHSTVNQKGEIGLAVEPPKDPHIVLFLEQVRPRLEKTPMIILRIKMDKKTIINDSSCKGCRSKDPDCVRSVVESSGKLRARQLSTSLDNWNLAVLGQFQESSAPAEVDKLAWVAIDFVNSNDRKQCGTRFEQLKTIAAKRLNDYNMDMTLMGGS